MIYRICDRGHITQAPAMGSCTHALSASHPECGAVVIPIDYGSLEEAKATLRMQEYLGAQRRVRKAARELERAQQEVKDAGVVERMARYAVIVSIPCPYCQAGVIGETCKDDNNVPRKNAPATQHGMRQDLSGVNGEFSRQHAIKFLAREKAKA